MSATPAFAVTPRIGYNRAIAAMDNAVDGSVLTGLVAVLVAGASGTRVDRVVIVNLEPVGVNTAATPQVYRFYVQTGADYRMVLELTGGAIAQRTTSAAGYQQTVYLSPALVLPAGYTLYAGITKRAAASDNTDFIAFGADL